MVKSQYILKGDYVVCRDRNDSGIVEAICYVEANHNSEYFYNRSLQWSLKINESWRDYNSDGCFFFCYHEHQCDIIDVLRNGKSIFHQLDEPILLPIFEETLTGALNLLPNKN